MKKGRNSAPELWQYPGVWRLLVDTISVVPEKKIRKPNSEANPCRNSYKNQEVEIIISSFFSLSDRRR